MRIALHGAAGRMGQALVRLIEAESDLQLVGAIEARHAPTLGRDVGEVAGIGNVGVQISADMGAGLLGADVVIDFSRDAAVPALLQMAMRSKVAVVSGTTGLDTTGLRLLDEAAKAAPVLWAPNMSLGVYVLAELAKLAAARLGDDFDIEILEAHHNRKVDAPSGTAHRLAEAIAEVRPNSSFAYGREGQVGARPTNEVGVLALRGGDVVGDHTVYFFGAGERIELTHRATHRDLFARGALFAARRIVDRDPGRYTMADVVGASLS